MATTTVVYLECVEGAVSAMGREPEDRAAGRGAVRVRLTHPAPGQARFTFTAPSMTTEPVVLHDYGEIAVALHYSGHSLSRDLTADQVRELVVRGVLAVGVAHIRATTRAVQADNVAGMNAAISRQEWRRRHEGIWSVRREQLCTDLADHVLYGEV